MSISASDVKKLRDQTGAGMMDCKKALEEADGDFDRAVEILRKKGQKLSEKRADREADQGLIVTKVSDDGSKAAALEINCETDFVARNDDFQKRADSFVNLVFEQDIETVDELLKTKVDGLTVADHLKDMIGKIGEKIEIARVILAKSNGQLVSYIHPGNQLGVLVEFEGNISDDDVAKDVAMQVAAMKPIAVNRDGVDSSVVEKELEIAKDQLLNEGKPEEIAEKAAQGKLRRFYEEHVLLEQKFVKDNSLSVQDYLKQNEAPLVKSFHRLQLGEDS
ncbi:translation elongation factor Ts [Aliifodinibius sp. S!AR15-10]|uniref:translation elongation factor Ts n=1 Tax=Aliifodinibius sp. S!AR15-10 TaxID=2950437 RepID=UPI00285C018F|nr:translation elongation factor Ts [Aliifodinibius sp. S!AR15-10]MDR8394118.1 translation elongation factor Ts [Aliifodinibius sp. S!AR15-10]